MVNQYSDSHLNHLKTNLFDEDAIDGKIYKVY